MSPTKTDTDRLAESRDEVIRLRRSIEQQDEQIEKLRRDLVEANAKVAVAGNTGFRDDMSVEDLVEALARAMKRPLQPQREAIAKAAAKEAKDQLDAALKRGEVAISDVPSTVMDVTDDDSRKLSDEQLRAAEPDAPKQGPPLRQTDGTANAASEPEPKKRGK